MGIDAFYNSPYFLYKGLISNSKVDNPHFLNRFYF